MITFRSWAVVELFSRSSLSDDLLFLFLLKTVLDSALSLLVCLIFILHAKMMYCGIWEKGPWRHYIIVIVIVIVERHQVADAGLNASRLRGVCRRMDQD